MASSSKHTRRLQACLAFIFGYLAVVSAGIVVRLEAHRLGLTLSQDELSALYGVLLFHGVVAVLVLLAFLVVRAAGLGSPIAAKSTLALMPFLLLASLDRIIAVAYEPIPENTGLFIAHATRGWSSCPGWTGRDERAAIRINRLGLRGPELPAAKAPNEQRILFLGDSVTFGSMVAEEACFTARVQELARRRRKGVTVTTVNASVAAYSPWQEYDLFVNEGLRCDPDAVLHVFCLNDVMEKFQLEQFGGYSRGFEPPEPSVLEWSGLYRATRAWWAWLLRPSDEELWRLRGAYGVGRLLADPDSLEVRRGWRVTLGNMGRIIAVAREHSLPLAIACVPHIDQLSPEPPGQTAQAVLAAFAAENGVPFLNLLPGFRHHVIEGAVEPRALFIDPLHLSPDGHRLAGELIVEFLAREGWLD